MFVELADLCGVLVWQRSKLLSSKFNPTDNITPKSCCWRPEVVDQTCEMNRTPRIQVEVFFSYLCVLIYFFRLILPKSHQCSTPFQQIKKQTWTSNKYINHAFFRQVSSFFWKSNHQSLRNPNASVWRAPSSFRRQRVSQWARWSLPGLKEQLEDVAPVLQELCV